MTDRLVHPRRASSGLARFGFALAVLAALALVLAGLGARWGWWHFRTGFTLLEWAAYGGIAAAVLSLLGIVRAASGTRGRGAALLLGVLGVLLGIGVAVVPWQWRRTAQTVPPIHDITTDTENPPAFVAVVPLRADAPNPIEYGGPEIARQQRAAYPEVRPLLLPVPPAQAFQRALGAARDAEWEIVAAVPAEGRIEATDRTRWFGFLDDVVIRVLPTQEGSRVDVRSLSRVGGSDVGANARRIEAYLERMRRED